jgi:hypothetical protein
MRRRRSVVLALVVCVLAGATLVWSTTSEDVNVAIARLETKVERLFSQRFLGVFNATDWVVGDGVTDDQVNLRAALAGAAGQKIVIPTGVVLAIGSPGDDATSFAPAAGTTIECADPSAGLKLGQRVCRGDARYEGAACTADADCLGGGRCTLEGGSVYAPSGAHTYTLFGSSGAKIRIKNCSIWVDQIDPYFRCNGGTNDTRACLQTCTGLFGGVPVSCATDVDCSGLGLGTCQNTADCSAAAVAGACAGAGGAGAINSGLTNEPGTPAGPGNIRVFNLTGAGVELENVTVTDHRIGTYTATLGTTARVSRFDNTAVTTSSYPITANAPVAPSVLAVADGLIVGSRSIVENTVTHGTTEGLLVANSTSVSGAQAYCTGPVSAFAASTTSCQFGIQLGGSNIRTSDLFVSDAFTKGAVYLNGAQDTLTGSTIYNLSTANGTTAVLFSGSQHIIDGNYLQGWNGVRARNEIPNDGGNVTVTNNRVPFGPGGAHVVITGAGFIYCGNYTAWSSGNALTCGGTCTNSGATCTADADCTACAGGGEKCVPEPAIWIGSQGVQGIGGSHPIICNNLVFTDAKGKLCVGGTQPGKACTVDGNCAGGGVCTAGFQSLIKFADPGKRCSSVTNFGLKCANDAACDGGGGSCNSTTQISVDAADVVGNTLYYGAENAVGIDLSQLGQSTFGTWNANAVKNNHFAMSSPSTPIKFPASFFAGLTHTDVRGNDFPLATTARLPNWDWRYGTAVDNGPMDPTDDDVKMVALVNKTGGTGVQGNAVEIDTATAAGFKNATAATTRNVVGVLLDTPAADAKGQVATRGITNCRSDADITEGDRLKMSGTAGQIHTAAAGDASVGVALSSRVGTGLFRCLLSPSTGP